MGKFGRFISMILALMLSMFTGNRVQVSGQRSSSGTNLFLSGTSGNGGMTSGELAGFLNRKSRWPKNKRNDRKI